MTTLKLLALDTGLFGDAATVQQALAEIPGSRSIPLTADLSPAEWDNVLSEFMAADKIITI